MRYFVGYVEKRWKIFLLCGLLMFAYNFYFIFLMQDKNADYLYYLDSLILVVLGCCVGNDFRHFYRFEKEKEQLLAGETLIYSCFPVFENREIAEHDVEVLQRELQEKFTENCELQDYVAKWCHEIKIKLASSFLLEEQIRDAALRGELRGELEKMKQQVNAMLLGCKLQGALFDLQIRAVNLQECVKESIRNNQFFLIQSGFTLDIRVENLRIYTDAAWLVYMLDQLFNNAIKYAAENPKLSVWTKEKDKQVELYVEDCGEGILEQDIRRIFEKGFTGSNYHNGKYKSTGMGLYMTAKIAERLGHEIRVESEYGKYTRFCITLQKM